jgi:hypothetical protein
MSQFVDPTPKYPVSNLFAELMGVDARGGHIVRHVQRLDQIEEECAYLRNHHPRNGMNPDRSRQLVARIPQAVVAMLFRRGLPVYGSHDSQSDFVKWLDSEEARPWRTSSGGV